MKKSQLRQLIRKHIKESVNEVNYPTPEIELRRLGIKYTLSGNKNKPIEKVFKPIDKSDDFYRKFDDVVDRYGLSNSVVIQNRTNLASLNEVADPSALELVGALSAIIGGSLGIKFGMDLLIKIVDKLLKKLNPSEAIKLFKNNAPALKAAAQEGKRVFVKKLMSLINNPTTTNSDIPFTIKRNEGTCGYDRDARTEKKFKTPGGL
jgi:hypothetical protein